MLNSIFIAYDTRGYARLCILISQVDHSASHMWYSPRHHSSGLQDCFGATFTSSLVEETFNGTSLFLHEAAHGTATDLSQLMLCKTDPHITPLALEFTFAIKGAYSWSKISKNSSFIVEGADYFLLQEMKFFQFILSHVAVLLPRSLF